MRHFADVHICGVVSKDVVSRETKNGEPVAEIGISVYSDNYLRGNSKPSFLTVVAYGEAARLSTTFDVGLNIVVRGKLKTDFWTGKRGGGMSKVKIIAEDIGINAAKEEARRYKESFDEDPVMYVGDVEDYTNNVAEEEE